MFLGKFNNMIKVEALKCANNALMRCNPHYQLKVARLATGAGHGTNDTILGGKEQKTNSSSVQNFDESIWTGFGDVDPSIIRSNRLHSIFHEKSLTSDESSKVASPKLAGATNTEIKVKVLPFGDSYGPLSNIIALRPLTTELQQRAYESSANNPYYDEKRFQSAHTERTTVSFKCPMPRRTKKPGSVGKNLHRKMDCASLKEMGALAVVANKPKGFGCKTKKNVSGKPNACGEIFECPRKIVKPPKKHCALPVSVLILPQLVQEFKNVLAEFWIDLNLKFCNNFVVREILSEAIAANVAQIIPTNRTCERLQSTVQVRNASFGVPKHSDQLELRNSFKRLAHKKITPPDISGLKISDAELLRLVLKDKSVEQTADTETEETDKPSPGESDLESEIVTTPATFLNPISPRGNRTTDKISTGSLADDVRKFALEGSKIGANCACKDSKPSSNDSKPRASKDYKPLPGQVCCPKGEIVEEKEPPKPPSPPPQICCPSKDKSGGQSSPPKPSIGTCPPQTPQQRAASVQCKKVGKAAADDPNIFNCCLSIVGPHKVEVNNCPMPKMSDRDVIVKMHTVALGLSDIYLFDRGVTKESGPAVLGHEGSGVVYKVGKNVKHLRAGDTVAIEPGVPCGGCTYCKAGRYNLCPSMKFNGLLQTYCSHPAHLCYKVPKDLDATQAALTQPVAMALHACRRANVCVGSTVVILGACPLGLSVVMAARAMGADQICIIDTLEKNLRLGYDLCADKTIMATPEMNSEALADRVLSELKAYPDVVIDCCGCSRTVNVAGLTLRPGGFFVLAGCQTSCADVPILALMAKEICACSSFRTSNEFRNAMGLIASRRANVSKLITHKTEFCEAQQGFEWALNEEQTGAIKVLVYWPKSGKR